MSVFYGGAASAVLIKRAHAAEIDRRLAHCGLLATCVDRQDHEENTIDKAEEANVHPIDEEEIVEDRFNIKRVSEEEEVRRYFAPFDGSLASRVAEGTSPVAEDSPTFRGKTREVRLED